MATPTIRQLGSVAPTALKHEPGEFTIGDAYLRYTTLNEEVMDIRHTVVPPEYRGQRIAEKLCEAAFELARENGLKVLPSCSYVSDRFVPKNEERIGSLALRSLDVATPGLEISVSWLGVARLRLSEARRRNPLTAPLLTRMRDFLRSCTEMEISHESPPPPVRTILIESTGPVFSSGHDFGDFADQSAERQRAILDICSEVNVLLQEAPQVSVAAVAGKAFAGGAQLAASCDLVLARQEDATFCLPGVRNGGFCHTPAVAFGQRVPARKVLDVTVCPACYSLPPRPASTAASRMRSSVRVQPPKVSCVTPERVRPRTRTTCSTRRSTCNRWNRWNPCCNRCNRPGARVGAPRE